MVDRAKLFKTGGNQAVRLPRKYRFRSAEVQSQGQSAIQLLQLARGQGSHERAQFPLEHQGEEITAHCRCPWKALVRTHHHLGGQSEHLAVDRCPDHGRDIIVLHDERARDDDAGGAPLGGRGEPAAAQPRPPVADALRRRLEQLGTQAVKLGFVEGRARIVQGAFVRR